MIQPNLNRLYFHYTFRRPLNHSESRATGSYFVSLYKYKLFRTTRYPCRL